MNSGIPDVKRTSNRFRGVHIVRCHGPIIIGIVRVMRQEDLMSSKRNVVHAPILQRHILKRNPERESVIREILAVKCSILMPWGTMFSMGFLIKAAIACVHGGAPQYLFGNPQAGCKGSASLQFRSQAQEIIDAAVPASFMRI